MGGCCFLFFFFLVSMCRYIQRCICTLFITKMWCFGCFQVCHSQSRPSKWESNLHGSRCLSSTCQSPSRLWHISSYVSLQHFFRVPILYVQGVSCNSCCLIAVMPKACVSGLYLFPVAGLTLCWMQMETLT